MSNNLITYNKLVRNRITMIIDSQGKTPNIKTLSDKNYLEMLDKKLLYEVNEYPVSGSIEVKVDIVEVMNVILSARNIPKVKLKKIHQQKADERRAFEKRYS